MIIELILKNPDSVISPKQFANSHQGNFDK